MPQSHLKHKALPAFYPQNWIVQYHAGVTEHLRHEAWIGHKILKKKTLLCEQTAFLLYEMLSSWPSLST